MQDSTHTHEEEGRNGTEAEKKERWGGVVHGNGGEVCREEGRVEGWGVRVVEASAGGSVTCVH